jgi:hypothetical protein
MSLGAELGRWLEAKLFVPDVSARVGNVAADAQRARGQHQCRNRHRQRGFRPLPFRATLTYRGFALARGKNEIFE